MVVVVHTTMVVVQAVEVQEDIDPLLLVNLLVVEDLLKAYYQYQFLLILL